MADVQPVFDLAISVFHASERLARQSLVALVSGAAL